MAETADRLETVRAMVFSFAIVNKVIKYIIKFRLFDSIVSAFKRHVGQGLCLCDVAVVLKFCHTSRDA